MDREAAPAHTMGEIRRRMEEMEGLIDDAITAFVDRCRQERTDRRQAILAGQPPGTKSTIRFSYNVLTYGYNKGGFRLGWGQLVYTGKRGENGKAEVVTRRLEGNTRITDMRTVAKKAHPEEVELLKSHEYQSRLLRKLIKDYEEARDAMNALAAIAEKVAKMKDDPMVASA